MRLGLPICSISWLYSRQQRTSNEPQEGTFNNNDAVPTGTRGNQSLSHILGLTRFYRKHIDEYARIVTPLTDLLKKGVNVVKEWTPTCTEAVETLKKAITKYPILRQFDPQRRIFLCTDASAFAIGGVLWQRYGEDPLFRSLRQPKTYEARTKLLSTRARMLGDCLLRQGFSPLLTWIFVRNQG